MNSTSSRSSVCHVCGKSFPIRSLREWSSVRPSVSNVINKDHPGWNDGKFICQFDLVAARRTYVDELLEEERGELGKLDHQIIDALSENQLVTRNVLENADEKLSFGDRVADRVASFGGSWTFILGSLVVLLVWMRGNVSQLLQRPFDPYPFILLNLVLSSLAALQAPVIMMSQRRLTGK